MESHDQPVALEVVADAHIEALRKLLKEAAMEAAQEALINIFKERPGSTGSTQDELHNSALRYLSRICKVHEETVLGNKVDQALTNAFDIYSKVNVLQEQQIKQVVSTALLHFKQQIEQQIRQVHIP